MRTSAIVIASGQRTAVYRKLDEVPQPLRDELLRSTSGENSATLVIADEEGAKELLGEATAAPVPRRFLKYLLAHWVELGACGVLAVLLCLLLAGAF